MIGVLIQQYDDELGQKSFMEGLYGVKENLKFAFLTIVAQISGCVLGVVWVKFSI